MGNTALWNIAKEESIEFINQLDIESGEKRQESYVQTRVTRIVVPIE